MTFPFTPSDRAAWLNLIDQADRLRNPKVIDLGPLKRAEARCKGVILPPDFQRIKGNPYGRLRQLVTQLRRDDSRARWDLITLANQCRDLLPPDDFGQIRDGRKDIYG